MPARLRLLPIVLLAVVACAGCITGERPTLGAPVEVGGEVGTPTGNDAVDRVLQRLERSDHPTFTATYAITRKLGATSTTGVVAQDTDSTSITVGDVRFLTGAEESTCSLSQHQCEPGRLDARISDYSIGSAFYAGSPARALRVAYSRRNGEPVAANEGIAGAPAACVQVQVGQGIESYCATELGPIARWDTAAVGIELTGLQPTADQASFAKP